MKEIVLAGGSASGCTPFTKTTNKRDLCITSPFAQSLRQSQILMLEISNIFLWLKFSPSLNLNKIEHSAKVSKHLLPIYDKPMIYYPITTLVNVGIDEILIITGGNSAGDFLKLLGNGKSFGLKHLNYAYQEGEGEIAAALSLRGCPRIAIFSKIKAYEKNYRRHIVDIPRIIF